MSAYGGAAALVVNKQETDRERRIRLRKQEFAAKNYSEKSLIPAEQPGTGSGSQLPALSHGSRRVPSAGSESSRTRDEVYEQKRKRFLEL
ncbi:hypothetical protein GUITHDRAFT_105163 [Guillardia theta CCMP2712]|uniref:Uncharacterized protein n=2 Tax=Guillardia theta TaxID=55529 RepID=L1JLR3_GUITC|nr:hypothetical protein GUITHDRAFT_105163 [Guillardia theta CCMP2712]EKX49080.1 hypothetical protein GUITHDRAFT_105163 [Guillardia theta CCMP2712]|eukprot:XP_005836060.1 hypothetical protein GUITHDRAFT_105163 [Guillardia theta CCMP2712]